MGTRAISVGDRVRIRRGTLMHGKSKWAGIEQEVSEILMREVEGTPVTFARLRRSLSIVPVADLVLVANK
jgi:hypothetical protein